EIFVAGAGNDTLIGNGGMDVFNAGVGNDDIVINASNITALEQVGVGNRARVDGGGGIDTLKLQGAGLTLDLTKISDRRIQDIEVIDITGSGNNTLKLNLDDVLHASSSTNVLKVLGNSGDEVIAIGFNDLTTEKTVNGVTYAIYAHSDANTTANAELWVQKGITLTRSQCGFTINGESAGDNSGYSVSNAGDVNGDGLDDLIVGAGSANLNGKSKAGKSYIVFGKQDADTIELSAIAAGKGGFVINGESAKDYSGHSVSSAGDVNGDGLDDLIVGTREAKSYIVFGKQDTNTIELSIIAAGTSTGGFVISGESMRNHGGFSISSAGDVNGDGLDDLIIGSDSAGKSYVVFGTQDSTAIDLSVIAAGKGGFIINDGSQDDDHLYSVSSAGDVNGDGLDDLIVGNEDSDIHGKPDAGKSYVVFGKKDTKAINLSDIVAGKGGFVINGEFIEDMSGNSVSSAGDVNGDGLDDLIVAAAIADPSGKPDAGKSYVVFGKKDNTNAIELSTITAGTGGFVINGESARDHSGYSVSNAGDVNGDGLDDLIVGAYLAAPSGKLQAGKSYVVFGKKDNTAINLSNIVSGIGGFVIKGESKGDYSGWSVSSAGDVNGDGLDDLIVGAYKAKSSAGKSYVIFGKTDTDVIDLSKLGDESKYTIDYLGDKNANTLTGTTKNEIFVAGAGNDTLIGNGGMDVFNAGV
ncbi:RTX toxins and related Ca2+-binding proteins, partial [uncultured Gammaproteobacteria bacterium]